MRKNGWIAAAVLAAALITATGCAPKKTEAPTTGIETEASVSQGETSSADSEENSAEDETESAGEEAGSAESKTAPTGDQTDTGNTQAVSGESTFTGTLEQNKGFMFIVKSDKDQESYAFSPDDEKLLDGFQTGDKIVITYTGEDPDSTDVTDTVIVKVEKQ